MGFPLCGDLMYGGSLPAASIQSAPKNGYGYRTSELLALQCCELSFRDPIKKDNGNTFRIEEGWWSTWLQDYTKSANENPSHEATTGLFDRSSEMKGKQKSDRADDDDDSESSNKSNLKDTASLSRINLSPGKHKYVIVKASKPDILEPEWYVRSASPTECGGLYHADVARSLVEELTKMGYNTHIMGGGRIDYCDMTNHAVVYGFSYGFGKGDHEFVSLIIKKYSDIKSSFDDSDLLY